MNFYGLTKYLVITTFSLFSVLYSSSSLMAQGQSGTKRFFGIGEPLTVEELPAGRFRDAMRALSPQARANALGILQRGIVPVADFEFMRVDKHGFIFYVDPAPDEAAESSGEPTLASGIALDNIFRLHSKPGASKTLYVDFDGHDLIDTIWNGYSGRTVLNMRPFSLDGDYASFSQTEINRIAES
ncbi:MAG: hypothetical protein ACU83O_14015, partial [Gammaproteobacteria bacterium]